MGIQKLTTSTEWLCSRSSLYACQSPQYLKRLRRFWWYFEGRMHIRWGQIWLVFGEDSHLILLCTMNHFTTMSTVSRWSSCTVSQSFLRTDFNWILSGGAWSNTNELDVACDPDHDVKRDYPWLGCAARFLFFNILIMLLLKCWLKQITV